MTDPDSKKISKKYSFRGYCLSKWWGKNKLWLFRNKEVIKALISALIGLYVAKYPDSLVLNILFGVGGAYGSKLIADAVDFWLSDVKL